MSLERPSEVGTAAVRPPALAATDAKSHAAAFGYQPESAIASVGTLDSEHVDYAARLVGSIPDRLVQAVHEPLGAVATICCLLLGEDSEIRRMQFLSLAEHSDRAMNEEIRRLMPLFESIGPRQRLPLVEMAIPALCLLSREQYRTFQEIVGRLVEADRTISLFEFALQRTVHRQLDPHFVKQKPPSVKYSALNPLLPSCACLLSTLAHAGHRDAAAAQRAFAQGVTKLAREKGQLSLLPREQCGLETLAQALDQLAEASPAIKRRLLQACAACIDADGQVTVNEFELLRVFGMSLDCPIPPLLDR